MFDLRKLQSLASPDASANYQTLAGDCYSYLCGTAGRDVILYSSLGGFWTCSRLAKKTYIDRNFPKDFSLDMESNSGWGIEFDGRTYVSYGPDEKNGEQIIFTRRFEGIEEHDRIELSQKFLHSLNLFWVENRKAFCCLDGNADATPVILRYDFLENDEPETVITMNREYLDRYMALTGTVLVTKFAFEKYTGQYPIWQSRPNIKYTKDYSVSSNDQPGASELSGLVLFRSANTKAKLVSLKKNPKYAKFKVWDWRHEKRAIVSCAPGKTVNYFAPQVDLPWEVTPAFFKPDVLAKYKADPDKYELNHRSINCRSTWHLQSYDVNDANQVHTYLVYLRNLPYEEQLYWQSFNEWPRSTISKRAIETDFEGVFTTIPDAIIDLKRVIHDLDSQHLDWWQPRPAGIANLVHYPFSSSQAEWAEAIMNLSQLLVEGFQADDLKKRLIALGVTPTKDAKSLGLLFKIAEAKTNTDSGKALLSPFWELQDLRSKVKGHATQTSKKELIDKALAEHGTLYKHFVTLANGCHKSLEKIIDMLKP